MTEKKSRIALLQGDSLVLLYNGSHKTIREIVENRLEEAVICYNENSGKFEATKVIDWHRTPTSIEDFYVIN